MIVAEVRPQDLPANAAGLDGVTSLDLGNAAADRIDRIQPVKLRQVDAKAVAGNADVRQQPLVTYLLILQRAVVRVNGALVEAIGKRRLVVVILQPGEPQVCNRGLVEDVVITNWFCAPSIGAVAT